MSKKMEEVREAGVRVVSEDFLQDASASASSLQDLLSAHVLAPWGADVKAEPVEAAAPKGKSGAALPKKSKGPAKEEGEASRAPGCPRPHPRPHGPISFPPSPRPALPLPPPRQFLFVLELLCPFPRRQQI